jgi:hypothetical protein
MRFMVSLLARIMARLYTRARIVLAPFDRAAGF